MNIIKDYPHIFVIMPCHKDIVSAIFTGLVGMLAGIALTTVFLIVAGSCVKEACAVVTGLIS